jgi:hypothetical protein
MTPARIAIALVITGALALPAAASAGYGDLGTVSVRADGGGTANGLSRAASGSSDGNVIAFRSTASNLIAGVTSNNNDHDIFVRDWATGTNTLVSHAAGAPTAEGDSASFSSPVVSGDGNWVAYGSTASDLVSGGPTSGDEHIYLYSRQSGANVLVDHAFGSSAAGDAPAGQVWAVSDSGHVVYTSSADDIDSGTDTNSAPDVFVYDNEQDSNRLITHTAADPHVASNGNSVTNVAASADGLAISFTSDATNIVTGTTGTNVFLWIAGDLSARLVSHKAGDTTAQNGDSLGMDLSADGKFLLYESDATDAVTGQTPASSPGTVPDVFLYDVTLGTSELVSHASGNNAQETDDAGTDATLSSNGAFAAWSSTAAGITGAGSPGREKIYLYDRSTKTNVLVSHAHTGADTAAASQSDTPRVSPDGSTVAYVSVADDLVDGQPAAGTRNVFAWSRANGENVLVSRSSGSNTVPANQDSTAPRFAGSRLLFESLASDLASPTPDGNAFGDIYVANAPPAPPPPAGGGGNPTTTTTTTTTTPVVNTPQPPTLTALLGKLGAAGPCHRRLLTDVALVVCGGNKKAKPNLRVYVVNSRVTPLRLTLTGSEAKAKYRKKTIVVPASGSATVTLKAPAKLRKALAKALKKRSKVKRKPVVTMTGGNLKKTSVTHSVTMRRK